jgi:hypothetical protein
MLRRLKHFIKLLVLLVNLLVLLVNAVKERINRVVKLLVITLRRPAIQSGGFILCFLLAPVGSPDNRSRLTKGFLAVTTRVSIPRLG